jgi:hypothetical protein
MGGEGWYSMAPGYDAVVTVTMGTQVPDPIIEIYSEGWIPQTLCHGESQTTVKLRSGETYAVYVAGAGLETVGVEVVFDRNGIYTNPDNPLDVSGDGYVSPLDALMVIQELNQPGSRIMAGDSSHPPYLDVNNDGHLSPMDALYVINYLNQLQPSSGKRDSVEGEASLGSMAACGSPAVTDENDVTLSAATAAEAWLALGLADMTTNSSRASADMDLWSERPDVADGADMPANADRRMPEDVSSLLPPASWQWSGGTANNRLWQRNARTARTREDSLLSDMESLVSEIARDVAAQWTL